MMLRLVMHVRLVLGRTVFEWWSGDKAKENPSGALFLYLFHARSLPSR